MTSAFTPAAGMLRRTALLISADEGDEEDRLRGDFRAEGPLDHLRRAEIWIPQQVKAARLEIAGADWRVLNVQVGFVPPGTARVSEASLKFAFDPPVDTIGAWEPNDTYSAYREIESSVDVDINVEPVALAKAVDILGGIGDLLPQLSAKYKRAAKTVKSPQDSVIRTTSDGERRIAWRLFEDPKTQIDPRRFDGRILFGLAGKQPNSPAPLLTLEVECRCGVLRMRNAIRQMIDVEFI